MNLTVVKTRYLCRSAAAHGDPQKETEQSLCQESFESELNEKEKTKLKIKSRTA